jgi:hypothetical protein
LQLKLLLLLVSKMQPHDLPPLAPCAATGGDKL